MQAQNTNVVQVEYTSTHKKQTQAKYIPCEVLIKYSIRDLLLVYLKMQVFEG